MEEMEKILISFESEILVPMLLSPASGSLDLYRALLFERGVN